jgi:hypothetical protein
MYSPDGVDGQLPLLDANGNDTGARIGIIVEVIYEEDFFGSPIESAIQDERSMGGTNSGAFSMLDAQR